MTLRCSSPIGCPRLGECKAAGECFLWRCEYEAQNGPRTRAETVRMATASDEQLAAFVELVARIAAARGIS